MSYKNKRKLSRKDKKNLKKAFGENSYRVWKSNNYAFDLAKAIEEVSDRVFRDRAKQSPATWVVCSSEVASALNHINYINNG